MCLLSGVVRTVREKEIDFSDYRAFADKYGQRGRFLDDVYNRKRVDSPLGYLTPVEFDQQRLRGREPWPCNEQEGGTETIRCPSIQQSAFCTGNAPRPYGRSDAQLRLGLKNFQAEDQSTACGRTWDVRQSACPPTIDIQASRSEHSV